MPLADFGAAINQDITALGPELLKLESTDVYQTAPLPVGTVAFPKTSPVQMTEGDFILGLFKEKETPNAFMVVNRDYKNEATAKLTLNFGNGQLWIFSKTESKWGKLQAVKNGTVISVPLKAGDGQLYKVSN